jgi:GNAT superfamily N-acetyltransferase
MDITNAVYIRAACLEDAKTIAILCQKLGYSAQKIEIEQRLKQLQTDKNHGIFVATQTNKIVGWVHVYQCDLLIMPRHAIVLGLIVDENYRRSGIGKKLMQAAENWTIKCECEAILLRSNIIRKEAHIFYEKIGYQNIKQSLVFQKDLSEKELTKE